MSLRAQSHRTTKISIRTVVIIAQSSCHPRGKCTVEKNSINPRGPIGHIKNDVIPARQESKTLK